WCLKNLPTLVKSLGRNYSSSWDLIKSQKKTKAPIVAMTTMKKLRWAMDGGFWDLDVSTPVTLDGMARPVPGNPLPLGLSRGTRLSRPKQIDFMQRFMVAPFVPSFSGDPARGGSGFALQRVLTVPFGENWFTTLLGQFNLQKFVSSVKEKGLSQEQDSTWWRGIGRRLQDKSLYALNFCSEILLTPEDTLLVSLEEYGDKRTPRRKAVFHHKFPHHNLLVEAFSPGLFVNKDGTYWDVPLSIAFDLASVASDAGTSYHLSMHQNSGSLRQYEGNETTAIHGAPATLLPGTALKGAFSFKKNIDLWRSKATKLKQVQPYDFFLSNPHVSASGIVGGAVTASFGDNAVKSHVADISQDHTGICFNAPAIKSTLKGDFFAAVAFTAQHGNFQRLFLDLTRFHACLDFPSGSKFLTGAVHLARDLLDSRRPNLETLQAICPSATLSLQQQIGGPFSVRVDSRVSVNLKDLDRPVRIDDSVFAIEYALQVLGSAKAVAWYAPKHREFMVELRFFET
ncbi:uncharacterized protein J3R85_011048, partial [Psidium guajava]